MRQIEQLKDKCSISVNILILNCSRFVKNGEPSRLLTLVVFFVGGVVRAAFHNLLHMFGLHVDGHGANDSARRRLFARFEADRTCSGHAHEQLSQRHRILQSKGVCR